MPRPLQYSFAGIILGLVVGVPLAYGLWRNQPYRDDPAAEATRELDCVAVDRCSTQPLSMACNVLEPGLPPTIGDDGPNKTARQLTLNEAIAIAVDNIPDELPLKVYVRRNIEPAKLNNCILNAEVAYWKLYEAYGNLYACEELMRLVHKGWMICKNRHDAGVKDSTLKENAPLLAKYHELRGNRMTALGGVMDAERNLRGIMGILIEDSTRLVPVTPPSIVAYRPHWDAALKDADTFTEKQNSSLEKEKLLDEKERTMRRLCQQYQRLAEWHERIEAATLECQAYTEALQAHFEEVRAGKEDMSSTSIILICGQLAPAMNKRFTAIAGYNKTRAMFEHVKGTLPSYRRVAVADGLGTNDLKTCTQRSLEVFADWLWSRPDDPFTRPADVIQFNHQIQELPGWGACTP